MMFGSNASFDDGDLTAGPPPEGRRSIYEYVGPNNNSNAADSVRPQVDRKKRKSISSLLLVHPPKTVETSSPDAGGGTLVYVPSDRAAFPPQTCEQARVRPPDRAPGAWQLDPVAIGGPDEHDFAAIELAQKMRAAYSSLYDRDVVTVFVDVMGLEDALRAGDLGPVQAAMEAATHALKHYKGMLRQFADDKGCVFIGVFGVPQHAHEDDEARAVGAALRVLASLATLGVDARAGIAAGRAYCGLVGTAARSEYAVLGSSVNLSARLMSHAPPNVLLVERNVRDGAIKSGGYAFHERGTIQAKGYDLPIAVFRPEKEAFSPRDWATLVAVVDLAAASETPESGRLRVLAGARPLGALTGATADAYGALKQLLRGGEGGLRARTFALKPLNPREAADFARDVFFGAPEQDGAPLPFVPKKRTDDEASEDSMIAKGDVDVGNDRAISSSLRFALVGIIEHNFARGAEHLVARRWRADPRRHDEAVLAYSLLVQLCLSVDAFELLEARAAGPHAAEAFLAETDAGPFDAAWRDRDEFRPLRLTNRAEDAGPASCGEEESPLRVGAWLAAIAHLERELFLARGLADDARGGAEAPRLAESCAPDLAARAKRTGEPTDEAALEAAGFALYSARFDAVDAAPALPLRELREAAAVARARLAAVHAATGDAKRAAATLRVARRDASRAGTRRAAAAVESAAAAHYGCLGAWDRCLDHGARAAAAHEAAGEPNRAAEERVARAHAHLALGCANRAVAALRRGPRAAAHARGHGVERLPLRAVALVAAAASAAVAAAALLRGERAARRGAAAAAASGCRATRWSSGACPSSSPRRPSPRRRPAATRTSRTARRGRAPRPETRVLPPRSAT
ncbi:adenylate cyclase [Aureococcus anophagefferens]|nr:adenylate cyclase [Aureococcus anophagefferens]